MNINFVLKLCTKLMNNKLNIKRRFRKQINQGTIKQMQSKITPIPSIPRPMQIICLPSIWSPSPCTISHSNRMRSFDKSKRFEFNSIYYKDDPYKPKHLQNPFLRPEILLHDFRKKIKQATKNYQTAGSLHMKKKSDLGENEPRSINVNASQVIERLYESPRHILPLRYDFNGNRSSFFEDQNKNQNHRYDRSVSPKELNLLKMQHKPCQNIYITSTLRTDLGKPLNFHPGPGSYYITELAQGDLNNNRPLAKSMQIPSEKKSSGFSKSVNMEKILKQQKHEKKSFEAMSKKQSTIDEERSIKEKNVPLFKRIQNSNKKENFFNE